MFDIIYVIFIVSYVYPFLSVKGTLNRIILDLWQVMKQVFFFSHECSTRLKYTVTSAKYAPIYDFFPEAIFLFLSSDCKNLEDFGQNSACVYCNTRATIMQDS